MKTFVRSCLPCQSRKTPQPRQSGELQLFSATRPFEVVGIDIFGPLPRSAKGNRYVVVMVDRFSRWTELAPVPDITAVTVADAVVEHIVLRHGCPSQLLSDRGSQFMSKLFRRMSERLGIKKVFTSAYHPQTNGQVERLNWYIAAALTSYVKMIGTNNWKPSLLRTVRAMPLATPHSTSCMAGTHNFLLMYLLALNRISMMMCASTD